MTLGVTQGAPTWRAVLLALSLAGSMLLVAGGARAQDGEGAPLDDEDGLGAIEGEAEDDLSGDEGDDVVSDDLGDEVADDPSGADVAEEDEATASDRTPPAEQEEPAVSPRQITDVEEEAAPDTEEEEAASEAPARSGPQYTFTGSLFTWTNAVTANTFSQAAQLSYDPTYQMSFSLLPRFYLTDTTFLMLNQSMSLELTDSNFDTYNREPLLADTLLDIRQSVSWEGFVFQFAGRLGFPLSKASQAANRILQTGLGLTVVRPFPELANFTVIGTFGYRRWWATTNVPTTSVQYPAFCPTAGDIPQQTLCNQASGLSSARDILLGGLILSVVPYAGLTISASGFYFTSYGHELADGSVPVNGGTVTVPDESVTHWRPFTYFSLAVGYDVLPWMNLQLGVQNSGVVASLYNDDGSVRSPFSVDTQVYLTATIGLDSLVNEFVSQEDDGLTPEERLRRRQGI